MSEGKRRTKRALLAASIAGIVAVAGAMANAGVVYADVQCAGINACKGQGECGGKASSCAGKNACKGQGWVTRAAEQECLDAGGTIVPAALAPAPAA